MYVQKSLIVVKYASKNLQFDRIVMKTTVIYMKINMDLTLQVEWKLHRVEVFLKVATELLMYLISSLENYVTMEIIPPQSNHRDI